MGYQLFKLALTATTNTSTKPNIQNFFYKMTASGQITTPLTITATKFLDDTNAAATVLPTLSTTGSYLLFINGVAQEKDLYTVAANQVTINAGTGTNAITLEQNSMLTLSAVTASSTSGTTVNS